MLLEALYVQKTINVACSCVCGVDKHLWMASTPLVMLIKTVLRSFFPVD